MAQYYGTSRNGTTYDLDTRIVSVVTTTEPVSTELAKTYLQVDHDLDDLLIANSITIARARVESWINRDILSRVREVYYPISPSEIKLLRAPINTDEDITLTLDGVVLDQGDYEVLGFGDPTIRLSEGGNRNVGGGNKLTIRYTTQAIDVAEVQQSILCCLAELYYERGGKGKAPVPTNWKAYSSHLKQTFI